MPKNTLIGRIGPDIFACLVPHRTDYKESLFAKLNEQINKSDIELNIVVHYGIYIIEDNNIKVGTICDRANIAIQTIKNRYDVFYKIYDSSIRESMVQERDIISHMYDALKNEEFVVYFQPKYDIRLEKIIGTEALVRWIHPEKGFILPGVFIPIFEKNGFISALDKFVWEKVCKNLHHWIDEGHEVIPCSVNVSRADLYNPTIDEFFQKILKKYNLLPKYIHLEITESAYTENSQQMIDTIMKFKKIGFVIEMDDFGTGYSSLNMLSDLQIDILKLDLRFMNNQNKNNNRSILSFVISLAKWLGLKVIAEGVETIEQVDFLRSLGCEYAQGFYYSRPLPQDLFESLLLKQFPKAQEEILENSQPNVYYLNWIVFVDRKSVV